MKHQPLALWRPIRNAFLKEYGLRQGDFELLMELHQVEYFTTEDFVNGNLLLNWDKKRWNRLQDEGWIEIYRERRGGSNHRYNIWQLSRKSKLMVRRVYKVIAGDEKIPNRKISKDKSFSSKMLNNRIDKLNDKYGT